MLGETHFNNPKILWCRDDVKVLETKIQEDLNRDNKDIQIHISAYILSVTSHEEVRKKWGEGEGTTKEQFADNKVLFIDSDKAYLVKIFENL